jgi:hypothetical protein
MSDLRTLVAETLGRDYFAPKQASALDAILLEKQASTDPELLQVASSFSTGNTLDVYENLGGSYSSKVRE